MEAFTIKITGSGINVEREVDSPTLAEILTIVLGGDLSGRGNVLPPSAEVGRNKQPSGRSNNTEIRKERKSLREYFDEVKPKRNPDKIVAIAKFSELKSGNELFSKNDIKVGFRSAGEVPPGNFSRDFSWTISNGWIAEDPENPNSYYVTNKGNEALNDEFSDQVRKSTGLARRSKKRSKGKNDELES